MKLGQVLSTVDFTAIPEGEREEFKETLAALRDDVPPLPFKQVRKLLEEELGGRSATTSQTFEEEAFAAASIGQVHRAVTLDGRRRRGQGPVPRRRRGGRDRPAQPRRCCSRWSSGWRPGSTSRRSSPSCASASPRSSTTSSRPRTTAPSSAPSAATRSPTSRASHTALSSRRVLVTDCSPAAASSESSSSTRPSATASARSSSASSSGCCSACAACRGDPHPGNYLLLDDGRVGFLDFGLMRTLDAELPRGRAGARARRGRARTPTRCTRSLSRLGYLPDPDGVRRREALLEQLRAAGEWYFSPASAGSDPQYVRRR